MKTVVFGGSGFLGSHVSDLLTEAGHDVTIFDLAPSSFLRPSQKMEVGDILDLDAVSRVVEGADYVYHFAGLSDVNAAHRRPTDSAKLNVLGTCHILEACANARVKRFFYASTVYVYSRHGTFYSASKQACEAYIENYERVFGLPYTILRYGSLYGRRARLDNTICRFVREALTTRRMTYIGDGEELREYINVEDAARMSVDALAEEFVNQRLILTGAQGLRVRDLMTMLREILGGDIAMDFQPNATKGEAFVHYKMTPYSYMPKPARKVIGNSYIDLGQGLLRCIEEIDSELFRQKTHMPHVLKPQAIIFDFDGVILESVDIKTKAFRALFADTPEHANAIERYHLDNLGVSRYEKFKWIFAHLLRKPLTDEVMRSLNLRFEVLVAQDLERCPFVPGACEFLARFAPSLPLFVASGAPEAELRQIVAKRGIKPYLQEVRGAPPGKVILLQDLLATNNLRPEHCLYVGDAEGDLEAARACGIPFVHRLTPAHPKPIAGSVLAVSDLHELALAVHPSVAAAPIH